MKLFKTITLTMVLMGLTACGSSPASNTNSKYITERHLTQNHWITQLDQLFEQHKLSQDYNPNPPTLNEVVKANIDIIAGKATVIDKLPILGVLALDVPKFGVKKVFIFRNMGTDVNDIAKRSQTTIHTNPKNGDITEIYVSHGASYFNAKEIDVAKLNLVFVKYQFDQQKYEDSVQYSISKVFTLKDNPKVQVVLLKNYQDGTCNCVHEKAQYDYDKTHLKQMQKFGMVKISLQ